MGNETEKSTRNEDEKADLRLMYQVSVADIAFFKKQQWKVTNYGLLLYGFILAIPRILKRGLDGYEYIVLFGVAVLVYTAGVYVLVSLDESLKKSRNRLIGAKDEMSQSFKDIWWGDQGDGKDQSDEKAEKKESWLWLFVSVMTLGLLMIGWLFYQMYFHGRLLK